MRPCFAFIAAADTTKKPVLQIFEEIGFWGVQAKDFVAQLGAVSGKKLDVEINSPGGDVFAALTMYNSLRASGLEVTTKVLGVAASAASLIFLAGDKREMPANTQVMAHNPWTFAQGNADELEETAATLRKIGSSIAGTYAARTGMSAEAIDEILGKDTWMTAEECLANGFATAVIDEVKVNAKFDLARADLPEAVKIALGLVKALDEPTAEELAQIESDRIAAEALAETERVAAEAQAAADLAEAEAAKQKISTDPVAKQINDLVIAAEMPEFAASFAVSCDSVANATARIAAAKEIQSFCAFAKMPEAAASLIKANKSVADARTEIVALMANADEHVSTVKKITQTTSNSASSKVITTASIWNSHNAQKVKKGS